MCGRYTLTKKEKLAELFREGFVFDEFSETRIRPRFNISPTQVCPIILDSSPQTVSVAKWGLVPSWGRTGKAGASMINARAETVASKPAFRKQRCLVPADGFYEWQKTGIAKVPHRFVVGDEQLFTFAGLWETWRNPDGTELVTYTIITTTPNARVAPVHDRMPVILRAENRTGCLTPVLLCHPAS